MPAYRFYTEQNIQPHFDLFLEGTEFHHLKNVMRAKLGDSFELINGMGQLAEVTLKQLEKHRALFEVTHVNSFNITHRLALFQAVPQIQKLDLIVEKSTELGVTDIFFFQGEKSQQKLTEERLERLKLKAIAALKQSGRYFLPQIQLLPPIVKWQESKGLTFYGDFGPDIPPLYQQLELNKECKEIAFICGPESGLTLNEIAHLKKLRAVAVSLHPNTLRTETAPLTFLSLASHFFLMQSDNSVIN